MWWPGLSDFEGSYPPMRMLPGTVQKQGVMMNNGIENTLFFSFVSLNHHIEQTTLKPKQSFCILTGFWLLGEGHNKGVCPKYLN